MDANAIAITAGSAAAAGFGLALGSRLAPALIERRRDLAALRNAEAELSPNDADDRQLIAHTKLHVRNSSIIGIYRDALRHADGAFTRAYHVELCPSVFNDDLATERRCDALARMLAARKPAGAIIQFRLSAGVD